MFRLGLLIFVRPNKSIVEWNSLETKDKCQKLKKKISNDLRSAGGREGPWLNF